jgi:hypothetical protein
VAHWNFVRRIEVATSRVVSCTVLRTPDTFTRPRTVVLGDVIGLAAVGARLAFFRSDERGPCGRAIGYATLQSTTIPKPEYVDPGRDPSLRPVIRDFGSGKNEEPTYFLWDLSGKDQLLYRFDRLYCCHPVRVGDGTHRLLHHARGGEVRLYDPAARSSERAGFALRIDSAAGAPAGPGVVCVGSFPPADGDDHAIALLNPDGLPTVRTGLPSLRRGIHPVAISRRQQLAFVLGESREGGLELMAFDANLRRRWALRDEALGHLLTDAHDDHVAVFFHTARGPVLRALGPDLPEVPADALPSARQYASGLPTGPSPVPRLGALPSGTGRATAGPVPDAIARCDRGGTPEERFRAVDRLEVWRSAEIQALARLADAAMDWVDGPWAQRVHAAAAYVDAFVRREQHQDSFELAGVPGAWSEPRLRAVKDRAWAWLDARADEDLGLLRAGPDDPQWPPAE